jgi:hypothetical protein
MADISDVEQAIVSLVAGLIYPNGTSQPSVVKNKAGVAVGVKVYRGWPEPASLDADLAAGVVNINVYNRGSVERNTTRFPVDYQEISRGVATVTATVSDNTIAIGGTVDATVSQFVTVLIGSRGVVSYAVQAGDTLATIATALAALITSQFATATVNGSTVTVESSAYLAARVGVNGVQMAEIRRQQTQMQIVLWCPDPVTRDNTAKAIEPSLAATTFLTCADTSAARFRYHGSTSSDRGQKEQAYRRDLIYDVEYATTLTDTATEITSVPVTTEGGPVSIGVSPGNQTTEFVAPSPSA